MILNAPDIVLKLKVWRVKGQCRRSLSWLSSPVGMCSGHDIFYLATEAICDDLSQMEWSVRCGLVWGKHLFIFIEKIQKKFEDVITLLADQSCLRHVIFFHLHPAEYNNITKCRYKHNCILQFWSGENQLRYYTKKFKKSAPSILKIHHIRNKTTWTRL